VVCVIILLFIFNLLLSVIFYSSLRFIYWCGNFLFFEIGSVASCISLGVQGPFVPFDFSWPLRNFMLTHRLIFVSRIICWFIFYFSRLYVLCVFGRASFCVCLCCLECWCYWVTEINLSKSLSEQRSFSVLPTDWIFPFQRIENSWRCRAQLCIQTNGKKFQQVNVSLYKHWDAVILKWLLKYSVTSLVWFSNSFHFWLQSSCPSAFIGTFWLYFLGSRRSYMNCTQLRIILYKYLSSLPEIVARITESVGT
jgi:hypothetical protein